MKLKIFLQSNAACFFLVLMVGFVQAQDKAEKRVVSIDLSYHQKNEELPVLKIYTKSKVGKKFKGVESVDVNVFIGEETTEGFLGRITTNKEGLCALSIPAPAWLDCDSLSVLKFIASVTANNRFEDTSTEIEIVKARMELSLHEEDSVRTIQARLLAKQDTSWIVVPETELKFVVKGYFNDLPISEDVYVTDDQGSVSAEFNLNIPGDYNGNILIGSKIDENETYGNIQITKMAKWGTPLVRDNSFNERTLWSTRDKTPLWLLIFPNLIIATVWGFIFYLLSMILRIRKIGLENEND